MQAERWSKLFFVATVVSGVVAAYLMYRRGASLGAIAVKTISNPVGALASEVGGVMQAQTQS